MATAVSSPIKVTPEVLFGKNPRQLEAWKKSWQHRFLLYGGAAGGGKSFFLRWWCVFYLMALYQIFHVRGAQVLLACEDYPSLEGRQIGKIEAEFHPSLGRLTRGSTREFTLADKLGSGQILLRNLDDPSSYLSFEFAGIAVDELTRNEHKVFDWLRLRLRWPGIEQPRFVAGTNPGGKGHGWAKKLWLDREFPAELEPMSNEFAFVQAQAKDNPFLPASYHRDLLTLPESMRAAYAEGRWDLFVGQYFTNFSPAKHCARAETLSLKPWNARWVSVDWGYEHPCAVYWHATISDNRHATYRELVENHLGPREIAREIIARSADEKIDEIFLSPDAFAHRTAEDSIAEQMGQVLTAGGLPHPVPADDDRIGGWMLMYQMLDAGEWVIADNCAKLIACLPNLVRDAKKVEDIAKADGDDAADAARYGLKSRLAEKRPPIDVRVNMRVEEKQKLGQLKDPTSEMLWRLKWEAEERRKMTPVHFGRFGRIRRWNG